MLKGRSIHKNYIEKDVEQLLQTVLYVLFIYIIFLLVSRLLFSKWYVSVPPNVETEKSDCYHKTNFKPQFRQCEFCC